MAVEIKIPTLGESISEVVIAQWMKSDGDYVEKDEDIVELETDKVNQALPAPESGILKVTAQEGDTLVIGDLVGSIEPGEAPAGNGASAKSASTEKSAAPAAAAEATPDKRASSLAKKVASEHGVNLGELTGHGHGGRITKDDVLSFVEQRQSPTAAPAQQTAAPAKPRPVRAPGSREVTRERMTQLRKRIAGRLLESQQSTATLTTFQECDMSAAMSLRKRYKDEFEKQHGVRLGFMSFFVKAAIEALKAFPRVNAYIDGDEIVFHHYYDVGIAVGTDRGLVVPILRNAEEMSFAEVEGNIRELADRGRKGKLGLDDLTGGTFTVSNGGVYGSMLSTPILNPPQSGILGMHNIVDRPVAIDGKVEIRPMMYLAFSYDHRIIDGTESVQFLKKIRDCVESPERMLFEL